MEWLHGVHGLAGLMSVRNVNQPQDPEEQGLCWANERTHHLLSCYVWPWSWLCRILRDGTTGEIKIWNKYEERKLERSNKETIKERRNREINKNTQKEELIGLKSRSTVNLIEATKGSTCPTQSSFITYFYAERSSNYEGNCKPNWSHPLLSEL